MFGVLESFWCLEMEDFESGVFTCLVVTTEVDLWRVWRRRRKCKLMRVGVDMCRSWSSEAHWIKIHTSENAPLPKSCNTFQSLRAGWESQR